MPWPANIIRSFNNARQLGLTRESAFNGAYTAVLTHLFPLDEDYLVVPQYQHVPRDDEDRNRDTVDFVSVFLIEHHDHPVFFIEVKAADKIRHISTRQEADKQMRDRYRYFFDDIVLEKLYGVSAIGTRLCFYELNRKTRLLLPKYIPDDPEYPTDTAPADRWNLDILTDEGEQRLREVVAYVKSMCSQLQPEL